MLKIKRLGIDTSRERVAFLNSGCTAYPSDEFPALTRIEIAGGNRRIGARLNIVDDPALVDVDELGLSAGAFAALGLPEGSGVTIGHQPRPASQGAIRRKLAGKALADEEVAGLIADMAAGRYGEEEIAAYVVEASRTMTDAEVLGLARANLRLLAPLRWDAPIVVDKHSLGGIPGNRVTMIVIPIVAAHGLTIPKTSSRAITSPAGTADCMEVLARVDLAPEEVRAVVAEAKGCIVWNGRLNHSPVDDVMNRITRPLGLDSRRWSVAAILAKKKGAGSTHVMIDMPVGPGAKLRTRAAAEETRDLFVTVGSGLGLTIEAHITDGTQPVGNGVGPALEARDVMRVLRGEPDAPADLRAKALAFAGGILEFDPAVRRGTGLECATALLRSGAALAAMERIVERQGPPPHATALGERVRDIAAGTSGTVAAIDCYRIAGIARRAGAPFDKGAGIDLFRKVGDRVRKGEPLYRIHAHNDRDFREAVEMAEVESGYTVT